MARPNQRTRKRLRVVNFIDEFELCGVKLRRHTLPNGKRVFEEEGVRELLLNADMETAPLTATDIVRFAEFTMPQARH